jgi:hypothetical protein
VTRHAHTDFRCADDQRLVDAFKGGRERRRIAEVPGPHRDAPLPELVQPRWNARHEHHALRLCAFEYGVRD